MSSGDWIVMGLAVFSALVAAAIVLTAIGIWMDDKKWKGDEE